MNQAQNQTGQHPAKSLEGEQEASPDRIEPEREPHPHEVRHISQQEMQKLAPPSPDPDDPQSPEN